MMYVGRWGLTLVGCLVFASLQFGASPNLGTILPRGGQRGTETTVTFHGARLSDAEEVLVYYPGISVTKMEIVNDGALKVTFRIAPDCRLGEHAFRVRCKSGISEMQTFWVGALPIVDEKEPNDEFAKPQPLPLNVTVHGVVNTEDVDYYVVEAKKGQRISVEIEAMRLGTTLFDPYVAILDAKRFELAISDDAPLVGQDGCASIIAPEDGKYFIQVRESAYGGNGSCHYRLHVGTFPRPTAVVPAGGKLGEELELTFLGDPAGPIKQKVRLPQAIPEEPFAVFCQDGGGVSPSGIRFRLGTIEQVVEKEPNNQLSEATPAPAAPVAFNGVIEQPGDVDYFRFAAKKGEVYDVHCYARRLGSALDPVVYLSHATGGDIAANDDAVGPDSYFRVTIPEDKEYVIRVLDHLGKGGPNFFYRVEITRVEPRLSVTIPKVDFFGYSQERQTIPVPRGNRWAVLATVTRSDVGGDLTLSLDNLPKGIKADTDVMVAAVNQQPIVFEAAPDAPLGASLGRIMAEMVDPNLKNIARAFEQIVFLVAVPNQGVYWRHDLRRAVFAVVEEAPFKIHVVEPKVPLVHSGSMRIKVIAERKDPFKGAITVYPLYNPPGVGSSSAITIPEGQTEGYFDVNANGGAPVRKWKTALIAVADAGKGPVWVSSQLFTLEIAPPYVQITMERSAVEQGKQTEIYCKVSTTTPFEGKAIVRLMGLPANTTAPEMTIDKTTKEFAFPVMTKADSPVGIHRNLFCQVIIPQNGETVLHNLGNTELRIDPPPPPKANAPAPPPMTATAPPAAAPAKRLSRLEQLRLEQQEREKAAASQNKKN
jgi:hypothetical protein